MMRCEFGSEGWRELDEDSFIDPSFELRYQPVSFRVFRETKARADRIACARPAVRLDSRPPRIFARTLMFIYKKTKQNGAIPVAPECDAKRDLIAARLDGPLPEPLTRCHRPMIGFLVEVEARHRRQRGCLLRIAPAAKRVLFAHEDVPRLLLDAEVPELAREPVRVLLHVPEPARDALDFVCRVRNRVGHASRFVRPACASEADPAPERKDLGTHRVLVSVARMAAVLKRSCGK